MYKFFKPKLNGKTANIWILKGAVAKLYFATAPSVFL